MILDTNMWGDFLTQENRNSDMQVIHNWLNNMNGKIAYVNSGIFEQELNGITGAKKWLLKNNQFGKVKSIDPQECANAEKKFRLKEINKEIKSDDPHILALAEVGNVKVLCTNDGALAQDFGNFIGGKVYENKNHRREKVLAKILRNSPPCRD